VTLPAELRGVFGSSSIQCYFDIAQNIIHIDSVSRFIAPVTKRVDIIIGPIVYAIGGLYRALYRSWRWGGLERLVGFGLGLGKCICVAFAVDTDMLYGSWREEALDKSKAIFSYSASFLCSFIAIAFCVFPAKSSGKMRQAARDENPAANTSGMSNDKDAY